MSRGDSDDRDRDDDRYDDEPRPRRRVGSTDVAAKVRTPGMILQVIGVLSIVGWLGYMGFAIFAPEAILNWVQKMQANAPAGADRDKQQKQLDELKQKVEENRGTGMIQNAAYTVVGVVLGVLNLLGGGAMKKTKGYGLAMTGSIAAMLPCSSLCCIGAMPFGIWALVVLLNADVKAAFGKGRPAPRDDIDDRRRTDDFDDRG